MLPLSLIHIYLWRLPSDREKVEAVLTRLCVNPMQDKVNNILSLIHI